MTRPAAQGTGGRSRRAPPKELAASRARQAELEEGISAAEQAQADAAAGIAQTESTLAEVQEQADALELALGKLRAGHRTLAERIAAVDGATAVLERAEDARTRPGTGRDPHGEARGTAGAGTSRRPASSPRPRPAPRCSLRRRPRRLEAAIRAGQDEAARVEELFADEELALAARELEAEGPLGGRRPGAAPGSGSPLAEREARDAALGSGLAEKSVRTLGRDPAEYAELAAAGTGAAGTRRDS